VTAFPSAASPDHVNSRSKVPDVFFLIEATSNAGRTSVACARSSASAARHIFMVVATCEDAEG
jgi:hypothetical protein